MPGKDVMIRKSRQRHNGDECGSGKEKGAEVMLKLRKDR
jgi:hypothetical protein